MLESYPNEQTLFPNLNSITILADKDPEACIDWAAMLLSPSILSLKIFGPDMNDEQIPSDSNIMDLVRTSLHKCADLEELEFEMPPDFFDNGELPKLQKLYRLTCCQPILHSELLQWLGAMPNLKYLMLYDLTLGYDPVITLAAPSFPSLVDLTVRTSDTAAAEAFHASLSTLILAVVVFGIFGTMGRRALLVPTVSWLM
ncbi:hypothetical protein FRC07_005460 [Ceratobasidium sp. 392]|nr:hypothetical protein FRC07_005460 [Ceratobasidium sp. 392]